MAIKKKTKSVLGWMLVLGSLGVFVYMKFIRADKMGGRMRLDSTPKETGDNVVYNGKKIPGWLTPGSLTMVNGYWTGIAANGAREQYQERGWIVI